MKLVRILAMALALGALAIAATIHIFPASVLLVAAGLHSRSSFCSRWSAARDFHVKQRQMAMTDAIARLSHLLRRESGLALWSTPRGEFWVPDGDDRIVALLLAQEDRHIYGDGAWGVRPGDVVLDVGAYIGTWTKEALAMGARRVIAIEPSPASLECLRRNLAPEVASGKVIIYPEGIWDSEGALTLFSNGPAASGIALWSRALARPSLALFQ